jgi:hypothetical protein
LQNQDVRVIVFLDAKAKISQQLANFYAYGIGNDVWIGTCVIIFSGVTIRDSAVVSVREPSLPATWGGALFDRWRQSGVAYSLPFSRIHA